MCARVCVADEEGLLGLCVISAVNASVLTVSCNGKGWRCGITELASVLLKSKGILNPFACMCTP